MTRPISLSISAFVFLCAFSASSHANLITNGDFAGFDGWTGVVDQFFGPGTVVDPLPAAGATDGIFDNSGGGAGVSAGPNGVVDAGLTQALDLTLLGPGTSLTLSADLVALDASSFGVVLDYGCDAAFTSCLSTIALPLGPAPGTGVR